MHPVVQFSLTILLVSGCDSAAGVNASGGGQGSNCEVKVSDVEGSASIREERASVHMSSPPLHLTCNVTLATGATQVLSTACQNTHSVKVVGNPSSFTPRITCGSNHLISWSRDFLDRSWSAQFQNSYSMSQRHYGTSEYEGLGFGFSVGANESLHILILSPEGPVSIRYTIIGLAGGVPPMPWTDAPITILLLFNPPQVAPRDRDLAIYAPTEFSAFEDVVLIPCLSSNINASLNPVLVIGEPMQGGCRPSLLAPPVSNFDPLRGFFLNLSSLSSREITPLHVIYFCCPTLVQPSCQPMQGCIQFKIDEPSVVVAAPEMPSSGPLRLFATRSIEEESPVTLECSFRSPVKLTGRLNSLPLNLTTANYNSRQTKTLPRSRFLATFQTRLRDGDVLHVDCVDAKNAILYTWNISVHDAGFPTASNQEPAYLKLFPVQVESTQNSPPGFAEVFQCYSTVYPDASAHLLRCSHPTQCKFMETWLDSDDEGKIAQRGSACSRRETGKKTRAINSSGSCQEVKLSSSEAGALLHCAAGRHSYMQLRWVGLSKNSTWVYKEEDFRDLSIQHEIARIRVSDSIDLYYTHVPYNFTCVVHTFWSDGLVRFFFGMHGGLQLANGSTVAFSNDSPFRQTEQVVFPSVNVDRVACLAPVREREEEWITASMQVRVVESYKPIILNGQQNYHWDEHDMVLPKTIPCHADGQPPPSITWSSRGVDGEPVVIGSNPQSNVHVANGTGLLNQLILVFEKMPTSMDSNFTCTAINRVGQASKDFRITISGTPRRESEQLSLWVAILVAVAASLAVLIIVVIFRRLLLRYRRVLDRLDIYKFRHGIDQVEDKDRGSAQLTPPLTSETVEMHRDVVLEEAEESGAAQTACESLEELFSPQPAWITHVQHQPYDTSFEISRRKFVVDKKRLLGSGEFGEVYAGKARFDGEIGELEVGVKVPKRDCPKDVLNAMLRELKIMTRLQHENIVSLVRACTARAEYGELYILMEYCQGGSLDHFLELNRDGYVEAEDEPKVATPVTKLELYVDPATLLTRFTFSDLVGWCANVASGMEYLVSKGILHRDLASRNVLLTQADGPPWTAKVSDFGLSRQLYGTTTYKQSSRNARLPARWMAPECFNGIFSVQSDVWAFGITAWEIFSLGELPYSDVDDEKLLDLLRSGGLRITAPHRATPEIFTNLMKCWDLEPEQRPSFTTLKEYFQDLISKKEIISDTIRN